MAEIKLVSIAELMDGRTFLIPSYQRGYRWTEKEMTDLLSDLYSFALKDDKKTGEFYCLQPIITQQFTDEDTVEYILIEGGIETDNKKVWTVIDGQQRLTSIFILYKYLLEQKEWDKAKLLERQGKQLFHLAYETRKSSTQFLENLGAQNLKYDFIDHDHISNAYKTIETWIDGEGARISQLYNRSSYRDVIVDILFRLLNCPRGIKDEIGSAQFIWYELQSTNEDSREIEISEFIKINTGKIALTDAELLKALFLQTRNFEGGEKEIKQLQIAMEWEMIENTLHKNDFWHFFYGSTDKPNRIDALFELVYKTERVKTYLEKTIAREIDACNKELKVKNTLFRHYYSLMDGKSGDALQSVIRAEWDKIMNAFHTLEDWYEETKFYNYVGFLSHCGIDIAQLYIKFSLMDDNSTKEDLEQFYIGIIRGLLSGVPVTNGVIQVRYPDNKDSIFNLLLLLNVDQQIILYENAEKASSTTNGGIFKFPFDVFDGQKWNLEHIDSYSTNLLKDNKDMLAWCEVAIEEVEKAKIPSVDINTLRELVDRGEYKNVIEHIKGYFKEDEGDYDKNMIGNLTLLDESTNKGYGNSLFCQKQRYLREREQNGTFIPRTTKLVFEKQFSDNSHSTDIYWTDQDKMDYQDFIVKSLSKYLTITNTEDESVLF
jgi:hypothetical protein